MTKILQVGLRHYLVPVGDKEMKAECVCNAQFVCHSETDFPRSCCAISGERENTAVHQVYPQLKRPAGLHSLGLVERYALYQIYAQWWSKCVFTACDWWRDMHCVRFMHTDEQNESPVCLQGL